MATVTISSLQNNYLSYLQAKNSKINAFAPNTYWSIQGGAMAAFFLDLYQNLGLVQNSIYIQNSVGNQCDLWLYSRGLVARGGMTYGTINCLVTSSTPVTITANTVFTDSVSGNQYRNLQALTVASGSVTITLYAAQPGSNYLEAIGSDLTAGSIIVNVTSATNGQIEESDLSCINRALMSVRIPKGGARETDYYELCLKSNATLPSPVITDAIIASDFIVIGEVSILGAFPLVGTAITEYQLNQGLLPATSFMGYSRQAGSDVIANANIFIQSQRLVGLTVAVGTSITYAATDPMNTLTFDVSLATGYTLSSVITIPSQDNTDNPITVQLTVEQLIQREVRRAICNQLYGATPINGQNTITIDSIIYWLNLQLSATNGQLAQLLTNITTTSTDIQVPNLDYNAQNVYYTYDITEYADIIVSQV